MTVFFLLYKLHRLEAVYYYSQNLPKEDLKKQCTYHGAEADSIVKALDQCNSALNNWTKENPDFQNDEHKQNYYTHALVAIANNKENNEEKKT